MPQELVTVYHIATGLPCRMHSIDANEAVAQGEYSFTQPVAQAPPAARRQEPAAAAHEEPHAIPSAASESQHAADEPHGLRSAQRSGRER
jgi:hypothetical protein